MTRLLLDKELEIDAKMKEHGGGNTFPLQGLQFGAIDIYS